LLNTLHIVKLSEYNRFSARQKTIF